MGQAIETGRFTLNFQQASKKLSGYSLPDPDLWILLAVQAANIHPQCTQLDISLTRNQVKVCFRGVTEFLFSDLKLQMGQPGSSPEEEFGGLLFLVAHSLRALKEVPFCIASPSETSPFFSQMELDRAPGRDHSLSLTADYRAPTTKLQDLLPFDRVKMATRANLTRFLREKAYFSAKPVMVDSKDYTKWSESPQSVDWSSQLPLLSKNLVPDDFSFALPLPPSIRGENKKGIWSVLLGNFGLKVSSKKLEPKDDLSLVVLVRRGVIVGQVPLGEACSVTATFFCNAEELDTDLTGFSVVDNQKKRDYLRHLKLVLGKWSGELSSFQVRREETQKLVESSAGFTATKFLDRDDIKRRLAAHRKSSIFAERNDPRALGLTLLSLLLGGGTPLAAPFVFGGYALLRSSEKRSILKDLKDLELRESLTEQVEALWRSWSEDLTKLRRSFEPE